MNITDDGQARARLWIALGNQPGVGAWFSVWTLAHSVFRSSRHGRKWLPGFRGVVAESVPCQNTK